MKTPDNVQKQATLVHALQGARDYWLAHLASITVAFSIAFPHVPGPALAAWTGCALLFVAWRIWYMRSVLRHPATTPEKLRQQWRITNLAPMIWGTLLAVFCPLVFDHLPLAHQAVLTVLVLANGLLGAINSSVWRSGMAVNLVFSFVSCGVSWLLFADDGATLMAASLLIVLGFCGLVARRQNLLVREKIALADDKQALADRLYARTRILDRSGKALTRLVASASHDLRQPVHALGMMVAGWRTDALQAPDRARVHAVSGQVEMLAEMLNTLLDLSQLEGDKYQPTLQSGALAPMLAGVVLPFEEAARRKSLHFTALYPGLNLRTDALLLRRMVTNLLANAVKYTASGSVALTCERQPSGDLAITVADTGPGIAPEFLDDVFTDYFSIARPEVSPGFGVGLAVVRRAAARLGYAVSIDSRVGGGTRVCITIPSACLDAAADSVPAASAAVPAALAASRLILLVEDDDVVRLATEQALLSWGHRVIACGNPLDAVALVASHESCPDLVISDYHLTSTMSGLQTIAQIWQACSEKPARAMLVTGDLSTHIRDAARNMHVPLLYKPLRPAQLRSMVTDLLQHPPAVAA